VLARNAETAAGEVDVIALSPNRAVLVMIEVPTCSRADSRR
jgi:Holliday junction resolvase-like predicted endonuclease